MVHVFSPIPRPNHRRLNVSKTWIQVKFERFDLSCLIDIFFCFVFKLNGIKLGTHSKTIGTRALFQCIIKLGDGLFYFYYNCFLFKRVLECTVISLFRPTHSMYYCVRWSPYLVICFYYYYYYLNIFSPPAS